MKNDVEATNCVQNQNPSDCFSSKIFLFSLHPFYIVSTLQPFYDPRIMPDLPNMSATTKELLKKVRMIVPPMLDKFHKGTFGALITVAIIFDTGAHQVNWVEWQLLEAARSRRKSVGALAIEESNQLTPEQLHRRPILFGHGLRTIRYLYPTQAFELLT